MASAKEPKDQRSGLPERHALPESDDLADRILSFGRRFVLHDSELQRHSHDDEGQEQRAYSRESESNKRGGRRYVEQKDQGPRHEVEEHDAQHGSGLWHGPA